jgi:hypothetical protein
MTDSPPHPLANENPTRPSHRWPFWGFLLSFLACGFAYLLVVVWGHPLPATWIVICIAGWMLVFFGQLNRWGILFWCLTAMSLSAALQNSLASASQGNGVPQPLHFLIPVFTLAGMMAFLVAAGRNHMYRGRNFGGIALIVATFICGGIKHSSISNHLDSQEAILQTTQMLIDLHRLGNEVESFRSKFNRLPVNEAEFVRFRGKPMPPYHGKYCYSYQEMGAEDYNITCCIFDAWGRHWDLFGYIMLYYGPNSTERIHAVLF